MRFVAVGQTGRAAEIAKPAEVSWNRGAYLRSKQLGDFTKLFQKIRDLFDLYGKNSDEKSKPN